MKDQVISQNTRRGSTVKDDNKVTNRRGNLDFRQGLPSTKDVRWGGGKQMIDGVVCYQKFIPEAQSLK